MRNWVRRQHGFTLIELLLVIAIISVIMVFGVNIYQQQALSFRIDKTALQMQQWLEASKAYYVNCQQWPAGVYAKQQLEGQVPTCNNTLPGHPFVTYVPPGTIDDSPWQIDSTGTVGASKYTLVLSGNSNPSDPNANYFGVSVDVPSEAIAQRIAGRLPNAIAGVDANTGLPNVAAYVSIPAAASNQQEGGGAMILGVYHSICTGTGTANCKYYAGTGVNLTPIDSLPPCPANMTMNIYTSLESFLPAFNNAGAFVLGGSFSNAGSAPDQNTPPVVKTTGGCGSSDPSKCDKTSNNGTALVIVTCAAIQQAPSGKNNSFVF